jgi:hypothetical protein
MAQATEKDSYAALHSFDSLQRTEAYALYYCSQHTMIDIAFVVQEACWLEDLTYAIPSEDLAETVPTSKRTELKVLWKVVP